LQRPGVAKAAFFLVSFVFCGVAAANNEDDGFVWLDANTKIKVLKPVSAASGASKAPEERKKPEKRKK
jgi:hypothetical protein